LRHVSTFSKVKPVSVTYGIGIAEHDGEGRVITTEFDRFYLVNTYIPNAGQKLERYAFGPQQQRIPKLVRNRFYDQCRRLYTHTTHTRHIAMNI
jgi:exonuclease III